MYAFRKVLRLVSCNILARTKYRFVLNWMCLRGSWTPFSPKHLKSPWQPLSKCARTHTLSLSFSLSLSLYLSPSLCLFLSLSLSLSLYLSIFLHTNSYFILIFNNSTYFQPFHTASASFLHVLLLNLFSAIASAVLVLVHQSFLLSGLAADFNSSHTNLQQFKSFPTVSNFSFNFFILIFNNSTYFQPFHTTSASFLHVLLLNLFSAIASAVLVLVHQSFLLSGLAADFNSSHTNLQQFK